MRIISSSVTRIVLPCPLVNIRVSPYRKPTSATPCRGWSASPPNQLGHNVEGYPAWQGQSIQGEFLFDPQNPSQGPWWECWWRCSLPLWLSLSPSLTEISPIDPSLCDGQHLWRCCFTSGEAWSGPGPRRVPPWTWQTSPWPPTRGQLCLTIWSGGKLRKGGLNNNLTALLSLSGSEVDILYGLAKKIHGTSLRPLAQLRVVAVACLVSSCGTARILSPSYK